MFVQNGEFYGFFKNAFKLFWPVSISDCLFCREQKQDKHLWPVLKTNGVQYLKA
jgi:hypothetical protein